MFLGCSRSQVDLAVDDVDERFEKGKMYLEKKKYYRAQQEFEYVLMRGRHTDLGDDAQFYLGESYYLNKEYLLAISEYDRLVRQMTYSPFVHKSRYRICQSYIKKSPKYFHDQDYTIKAINKLQEFIEDYPESEFRDEVAESSEFLRAKLARKAYESAVLYTKMEEYESAIRYYTDLLTSYYDTDYADRARLGIVEIHLKVGEIHEAEEFISENENKFRDEETLRQARSLLEEKKTDIKSGGKT
jgi:outer membrane protein assembly factor BamD|tara:strand:+ start:3053 stop:3784 length:732 start_codon:yes stop_codon:yes gene_type:complete